MKKPTKCTCRESSRYIKVMASPTMPASCVLTRELADTETRERLQH